MPFLLSNSVITLDKKKMIEKNEQNELKGMHYFLTEVIITSLKLNIKDKYKGFLIAMEQHDNQLIKLTAQKLGL